MHIDEEYFHEERGTLLQQTRETAQHYADSSEAPPSGHPAHLKDRSLLCSCMQISDLLVFLAAAAAVIDIPSSGGLTSAQTGCRNAVQQTCQLMQLLLVFSLAAFLYCSPNFLLPFLLLLFILRHVHLFAALNCLHGASFSYLCEKLLQTCQSVGSLLRLTGSPASAPGSRHDPLARFCGS